MNPPNYGEADKMVLDNTANIHKNEQKWYRKTLKVVDESSHVHRDPSSRLQMGS